MGTSGQEQTTLIGWQGYSVVVPEDWTIGAIGGDRLEGYLRIDGPDMPRCELKWFDGRGPISVGEVVGNYLRDLQKKRRRRDPEISSKRDTRLFGRRKGARAQLETFWWTDGDRQAHGAAWRCLHCDRITIVQVLGSADEAIEGVAKQVMLSINDHASDGWVVWATYGLRCEIPEEFVLDKQRLMAGLLELTFRLDTEQITVRRWGMADVALAGKDLRTWAQKELRDRLKGWTCVQDELEFNGHPAIAISGEPASAAVRCRRFVLHCLRKPYGSNIRTLTWHCPEEKKIYSVEAIVDDSRLDLPSEICRRVVCH